MLAILPLDNANTPPPSTVTMDFNVQRTSVIVSLEYAPIRSMWVDLVTIITSAPMMSAIPKEVVSAPPRTATMATIVPLTIVLPVLDVEMIGLPLVVSVTMVTYVRMMLAMAMEFVLVPQRTAMMAMLVLVTLAELTLDFVSILIPAHTNVLYTLH
jgi:hypothetical protein